MDVSEYGDAAIWCQVRTSTDITSLVVETSPTKDDNWFKTVATPSVTAATSPTVAPVIFATATYPLARYLRWKVTAAGSGSPTITFRIWVVGNPVGR